MPSVKHQSISIWDRSGVRLVISALILLLLHLPLIFLRAPNYHNALSRPLRKSRTVVALPGISRLTADSCLKDLHDWADIADCSTNYQLSQKNGYLQFVPRTPPRKTPPFPQLTLTQLSSPRFSFAQRPLGHGFHSAEQLILQYWPDFIPLPPSLVATVWQEGIFWQHSDGHPLKNPPSVSRPELQKALSGLDLSRIVRPTVLEIILQPELNIPRVIIRRSCGLSPLDLFATRLIRREIEKAFKTRPELRRIMQRTSCRLQADWRLSSPGPQK